MLALSIQCQMVLAADKTVHVSDTDNLNFNYAVKTEKAKYVPLHIFDDGKQTYLLLPERVDGKNIRIFGKTFNGNYDLVRIAEANKFIVLQGIYETIKIRIDDVLIVVLHN